MRTLRELGARGISEMSGWFAKKIAQSIKERSYWCSRFWYRLWWCILCRYDEAVILFYGWDDCGRSYNGW